MSGEPTSRSDKQWIDPLVAAHDKGYLEGYAAGRAAEKAKVARLMSLRRHVIERFARSSTDLRGKPIIVHGDVEHSETAEAVVGCRTCGLLAITDPQYLAETADTAEAKVAPILSIEGVTRWMRSDSDDCICCVGQHVFSRGVDTKEGPLDVLHWLFEVLRRAPEGARIRLSAILADTAEAAE